MPSSSENESILAVFGIVEMEMLAGETGRPRESSSILVDVALQSPFNAGIAKRGSVCMPSLERINDHEGCLWEDAKIGKVITDSQRL